MQVHIHYLVHNKAYNIICACFQWCVVLFSLCAVCVGGDSAHDVCGLDI